METFYEKTLHMSLVPDHVLLCSDWEMKPDKAAIWATTYVFVAENSLPGVMGASGMMPFIVDITLLLQVLIIPVCPKTQPFHGTIPIGKW